MRRLVRSLLLCLATVLATVAVGALTAVVAHVRDENGTPWGDTMDGHEHVDKFHGLGGSDELLGRGDNDKLWGGPSSGDILRGMENNDELDNADGYANDKGYCGNGSDTLFQDGFGADQTDGTCENVSG